MQATYRKSGAANTIKVEKVLPLMWCFLVPLNPMFPSHSMLLLCSPAFSLAILDQWFLYLGSSLESTEELLQKISAWVHSPGLRFNWCGVGTPVLPSTTDALQKLCGKPLWPAMGNECLTEEDKINIRKKELMSWSSTQVQNLMTHMPSHRNNLPKIALYIVTRIFRKELYMWMPPKDWKQVTLLQNLSQV